MKIKKQELQDADLPGGKNQIEDEIIDNSRWSIQHRIVFKWTDGKYYQCYYSVGATEQQDESPWEYDDEVACIEVEQEEVTIKKWVKKK